MTGQISNNICLVSRTIGFFIYIITSDRENKDLNLKHCIPLVLETIVKYNIKKVMIYT